MQYSKNRKLQEYKCVITIYDQPGAHIYFHFMAYFKPHFMILLIHSMVYNYLTIDVYLYAHSIQRTV
jgi:hypothetical protein